MMNSQVNTAFSLQVMDRTNPLGNRRQACAHFNRARLHAKWRVLMNKLWGKAVHLPGLTQVAGTATRMQVNQSFIINVPIEKIVGSEDRTKDFDNKFNPLCDHNRDRWVGIAVARQKGIPLPPVELIQVNDAYVVRDGHHRISVAQAYGQAEIEAQIAYKLVISA